MDDTKLHANDSPARAAAVAPFPAGPSGESQAALGTIADVTLGAAAGLRCAGCGARSLVRGEVVASHRGQLIQAYCAECGGATIALCPQDLEHSLPAVLERRGFRCQSPGCAQRFFLAPRAIAEILPRLLERAFEQACGRCGGSSQIRVPYDLESFAEPVGAQTARSLEMVIEEDPPFSELVAPGTRVGPYVIGTMIAEGGAGMVYRASTDSGGVVAIKVLRRAMAQHPQLRQRFFQEIRLISRIRHPNIVGLLDHGELPDHRPYLVMELLEGCCLRERLGGPVPITHAEAFDYFAQLCDALITVHAEGVVHRDLKPENVLLTGDPTGPLTLKLIDFGVAKVLQPSASMPHMGTAHGLFVGSPGYMAPEQIRGDSVDPRCDIYALGLIMYEVFTGGCPWDVPRIDPHGKLKTRSDTAPIRAGRLALGSGELSELVMSCLAKRPVDRPQSVEAVRGQLESARKSWHAEHGESASG